MPRSGKTTAAFTVKAADGHEVTRHYRSTPC
jgi:hypothetical protein